MDIYGNHSYYRRFRPPMNPINRLHSRRVSKVRAVSQQALAKENDCRRNDPQQVEPAETASVESIKQARRIRSQGLILGFALLAAVAGGLLSARWNLIGNKAANSAEVHVADPQETSQIAADVPPAGAASTERNPATTTPFSTAIEMKPQSMQATLNNHARRQTEQLEIDFVYTEDITKDADSERTILGILLDAVQKLEGK